MWGTTTTLLEGIDSVEISTIRELFELSSKVQGSINLTLGEPDYDTPQHIKEAARKALDEGYTHYTPSIGYLDLREAISKKFKRENGFESDPETEVIVTPGATQGILLSIASIAKPGTEILIPTPAFVAYEAAAKLAGVVPKFLPTSESNDFKLNFDELEKNISKKTVALVLNSPCNPTGTVYSRTELENLAKIAVEHNLYILSDEVYEKFVYEGQHFSVASLEGLSKQVITINSLSKTHAMTGWRIGFLAAPSELASRMLKLQMYSAVCPSAFCQRAALAALEGSQNHVETMIKDYSERRELLRKTLGHLDQITFPFPKGAFYAFINVSGTGLKSREFAVELLQNAGVAVAPGHGFGPPGELYVRISFAARRDLLEEGLKKISNFVSSHKSRE